MDDYKETQNENQEQTEAAARNAHEQALEVTQTAQKVIQDAREPSAPLKADSDDQGVSANPADSFAGLPIESLICNPIIAAAKGQQELSAVYIDTLMNLAYADGGSGTDKKTNTLDFTLQRPVIQSNGTMTTQDVKISAPLLSLVPVPAFTMDELTVDFNMEVKSTDMTDDKTHDDVQSTVGFKSWFGLNSSITGNVSSDTDHKRQTDSSATYTIHARAVQQPPTDGMQKLTSLFTSLMEPISTNNSGQG